MVCSECRITDLIPDHLVIRERQRTHLLKTFDQDSSKSRGAHLCNTSELCNLGDLRMHLPCIKDWWVVSTDHWLPFIYDYTTDNDVNEQHSTPS